MSTQTTTNTPPAGAPPAVPPTAAERLSQALAKRRELVTMYDALLKRVGAGEMALYNELTKVRAEREAVDHEISNLKIVREQEDSIEADLRRVRMSLQMASNRKQAYAEVKEALDLKLQFFSECISHVVRAHENFRECLRADHLSRLPLRTIGDRLLWDEFALRLGTMRNSVTLARELATATGIAVERIDQSEEEWTRSVRELANKLVAELKYNHEQALERIEFLNASVEGANLEGVA